MTRKQEQRRRELIIIFVTRTRKGEDTHAQSTHGQTQNQPSLERNRILSHHSLNATKRKKTHSHT